MLRMPFARVALASRTVPAGLLMLTALLLVSTASPCFAARFDALLGTFELRNDNGSPIESIRIERQQQKYVLYRARGAQSQAPVEIAAISRAELEAIVKQPVDANFEALGNGKLAVLKVPKGWKVGAFTCRTGYLLATVLGPAELEKVATDRSRGR